MDILARLRAPFPADRVSWRVGSTTGDKKRGMALAYIDARDVMERLDEAVGAAHWQCDYPHANGKTVCRIGINVGEWVWKADGAGDTDFEAEKGALSDAFKRAAVRWGIGRYLYDIPAPWVAIEPMGKSFKIAEAEHPRLRALLDADSKARFITGCRAIIAAATDAKVLGAWWNSDEQKQERRDHDLQTGELHELKAAVTAKCEALTKKAA
jgi:hypothetical protein